MRQSKALEKTLGSLMDVCNPNKSTLSRIEPGQHFVFVKDLKDSDLNSTVDDINHDISANDVPVYVLGFETYGDRSKVTYSHAGSSGVADMGVADKTTIVVPVIKVDGINIGPTRYVVDPKYSKTRGDAK